MRRPPVLVGAQRLSPGLSRGTAAELWAELPTAFARTVFPLAEQPYAALFYRRAGESSAVVDCSSLPRAMGCEMAWWLHALTVGGERVTAAAVRMWTRLVAELNQARAQRGQSGIESFLDLPLADWMAAARLAYVTGTGQLPPPRFAHAYEPMLRRLHGALVARCDPAQWWRAEVWDPTHDPRIPLRPHEATGGARLSFTGIEPRWLADAARWFLAVGLQSGAHTWPSVISYRTHLGTYFGEFLAVSGITTPTLCADPTNDLHTVALGYLEHLRTRPAIRAGRTGGLSAQTIGTAQSVLASFYTFMLDHRTEAAKLLGEPRWSELGDAHSRLWREGELLHRRKAPQSTPTPSYLEPTVLSRIVEHLDILALPTDQSRTVLVDGRPVEVAGLGDEQAMRAYLLAMLTGRRINEILLMDFQPLDPIVGLATAGDADPDAFVARLRYQQTKIAGAPNTILVEQAVVNIISEQQAWIRRHVIPTMLAAEQSTCPIPPRYLFVAAKRNRRGQRPYHANTLRTRLGKLAEQLKIRDSTGVVVDFQRTHRLRHTKATELINAGVPLHVVQRYLGHRSPEMTMHYAATLAQTHEREFLRLAKIGRDGRPLDLDPADIYELAQLDRRTDRILPNGVCLLPPTKRCDKGNACARCEHFATDRSHLSEHRQQLAATLELIEQRKAQHLQRTGTEMTQDNVWLDARIAETGSLQMIITALENEATAGGCALRGAGTPGRAAPGTPQPISIDTTGWRNR